MCDLSIKVEGMSMREDIYSVYGFNRDPVFHVMMAGISYCDASYYINRKNSPITCIEYIIEGSGTVMLDGKKFRAKKGDVYILGEGHDQEYYSDAEEPWVKIWMNLGGSLCGALINEYGLENAVVIENAPLGEYWERAVALCKEGGDADETNRRIAVIFHEIIQKLSRIYNKEEDIKQSEAAVMKNYIDKNYWKEFDISELAKLIYKSNSQTIRIFKKAYGQTPYDYFLEQRFKLSKELLRNTNMLIKEIAYQVGFQDEHYFSGLFKKRFNMSPREYRRKND